MQQIKVMFVNEHIVGRILVLWVGMMFICNFWVEMWFGYVPFFATLGPLLLKYCDWYTILFSRRQIVVWFFKN
jgi:hypothetical protein